MMDHFTLIAPQLSQVAEGFAPEVEPWEDLLSMYSADLTMLTSSLEDNLGKKDFDWKWSKLLTPFKSSVFFWSFSCIFIPGFLKPWYYWHFGPDYSLLWGTVLCIVGQWVHLWLYPLNTSSSPHSQHCDHQKCLQMLTNVPLGGVPQSRPCPCWETVLYTPSIIRH